MFDVSKLKLILQVPHSAVRTEAKPSHHRSQQSALSASLCTVGVSPSSQFCCFALSCVSVLALLAVLVFVVHVCQISPLEVGIPMATVLLVSLILLISHIHAYLILCFCTAVIVSRSMRMTWATPHVAVGGCGVCMLIL